MNIREANIVFLETEELGLASLKEKLGDESRILCFSSPFALYEYALQNPVQVVISSGYMNSASGVSFMDTLRKYIPDLAFIFYSDNVAEGTNMSPYEAGVC